MTKQITEAIHNLIAVLSVFSGDSITLAAINEGKKAIENVEKLRAALKPFAFEANEWKCCDDAENIVGSFPGVSSELTVADLRRARGALK